MWLTLAAALLVAVPGAVVGGAQWFARVRTLEIDAAAPPPRPVWPRLPPPWQPSPTAYAATVEAAASAPREQAEGYAILVASFDSPARAESLVTELTRAGFTARSVDHDWGPPRGRLFQVRVGGYSAVSDVARDLERIRQLPGRYTDARVVERQ